MVPAPISVIRRGSARDILMFVFHGRTLRCLLEQDISSLGERIVAAQNSVNSHNGECLICRHLN